MSDAYDYFTTTEVSARLDLVRHLIENSELVPLVRGPSGIGKTLLASRLQQLSPDNWSVCHFSADPTMQPERLLAYIARCSGLPDIAGELLQRLVDRFEMLRKRGRIPVLLVDDAQMLPPTSLMTLLRLFERQVDGVRLVSIVLFADEQIDLLLSTPQLQVMSPQAIQVIDLPPMTRQEATPFMFFLLNNEGLTEKLALDEVKLSRIYKETKGNPGLLATAILNAVGEDGQQVEQSTMFSGYRKQLLVGGVPLLVLMLGLLFFQGPINNLFEADSVNVSDRVDEGMVEPSPGVITQSDNRGADLIVVDSPPPPLLTGDDVAQDEAVNPVSDSIVLAQESEKVGVESPAVQPGEDEQTPLPSPVKVTLPATEGLAQSDEATHSTGILSDTAAGSESTLDEDQVEPDTKVAINVETEQVQTESPAKSSEVKISVGQELIEKEVPVEMRVITEQDSIAQKTSSDKIIEKTTPTNTGEQDKEFDWIVSRPPESFTLQLIAVENLDSLQVFIDRNRLGDEAYTFKTIRNGAPWYALLWGVYPDRNKAEEAVTSLPSAVRKGGVWVRSFASLQQTIPR
ncbi:MAG: AAA family ATPase [Candidatus Thiodiazotropha sp. (ex Lucinoma borealis)]|nr:AAA family ATPase [Candidatus Thiodiazotropha sp. (ex Lucinoma borealis)]